MSENRLIKEYLEGHLPQPHRVQFHLTNRCNLKCIFCWQYFDSNSSNELSDDKWVSLSKEIFDLGVNRLTISGGGEPLIRKNVVSDIIKNKKNTEIEIITNGTLISSDIAKTFVDMGLENIIFSIGSPFDKKDSLIRGGESSLKKTIRGIDNINYWKEKFDSDIPKTSINMVILKQNYNDIYPMTIFSEKNKISKINLRMVNEKGKDYQSGEGLLPTRGQLDEFFMEIDKSEKLAKSSGIEFDMEFNRDDIDSYLTTNNKIGKIMESHEKICLIPFHEMVVFANGNTSQCCNFFDGDVNFVDNIKNKTLSDVWWGNKFNRLRESILKRHLSETCKDCSLDLSIHQVG